MRVQALEEAAALWDSRLAHLGDAEGDAGEGDQWIVPGDEEGEGVPWTARNSSELTPLINKEIMWLLKVLKIHPRAMLD